MIQIFTCKYILEVFKIVRSHLGGYTAGPDSRLHQGCLVQCGGKGGEKGGVEKRIIQQKQNAVQRYGAIRNAGHGVMVVLNLFPNCCSALLKALQYDKQVLLPVSVFLCNPNRWLNTTPFLACCACPSPFKTPC